MLKSIKNKHNISKTLDKQPVSIISDADFELIRLITLTSDAIHKVRQKELDLYKIHIRRSAIIRSIFFLRDNATPTTIARQLSRERHTIREQLIKMQQDGLVKIVNDLQKKNMIRVVLTKKGIIKYQQIQNAESLKDILSPISDKERAFLMKYLNIIKNKALENMKVNY